MAERSVHRTLNLDTYEALQAAGLSDPQARVLAAAIPDLEPLRTEMDHRFVELRGEMDHRFAELRGEMDARFAELRADIERRLNAQTWTIVGTLVAIGGLVVATNLWG